MQRHALADTCMDKLERLEVADNNHMLDSHLAYVMRSLAFHTLSSTTVYIYSWTTQDDNIPIWPLHCLQRRVQIVWRVEPVVECQVAALLRATI